MLLTCRGLRNWKVVGRRIVWPNMSENQRFASPDLRKFGNSVSWGDCGYCGRRDPSTSNPSYWNGDIDWYAPAEIGEQIFFNRKSKENNCKWLTKCSAALLPVGTVLFTSLAAGIGNTAILRKASRDQSGAFNPLCPISKLRTRTSFFHEPMS